MNASQIIAAIPKLTPADLAKVEAAIKAAKNFVGSTQQSPAEYGSDALLNGIGQYLVNRKLLASMGKVIGLTYRDAFKQYRAKAPNVIDYLGQLLSGADAERRAAAWAKLTFLSAQALGAWLEKRKLMSVSTMLSQIDKIPEALEEAYPGYASAGMVRFLLEMSGDGK